MSSTNDSCLIWESLNRNTHGVPSPPASRTKRFRSSRHSVYEEGGGTGMQSLVHGVLSSRGRWMAGEGVGVQSLNNVDITGLSPLGLCSLPEGRAGGVSSVWAPVCCMLCTALAGLCSHFL